MFIISTSSGVVNYTSPGYEGFATSVFVEEMLLQKLERAKMRHFLKEISRRQQV